MTNEEIITELTRENLEFKKILKMINVDAININGILYSVGGGLNDNILNYTTDQMKDLKNIADLAECIRESIPIRVKA